MAIAKLTSEHVSAELVLGTTANEILFSTQYWQLLVSSRSTQYHHHHHHHHRQLWAQHPLVSLLLSLPTAAYLGQRGLTPAGLPHTTAQCHLTILGEAVLFCLNHPSFRTPGFLSFYCRPFCRYGRRDATFSVSLSVVWFLPIESFCTILHTIPQVILGKTCLKLLVTLTME